MEFGAARRLTPLAPGVWRSLVAHSLWERGAVGSNPATPTTVMSRDMVDTCLVTSLQFSVVAGSRALGRG